VTFFLFFLPVFRKSGSEFFGFWHYSANGAAQPNKHQLSHPKDAKAGSQLVFLQVLVETAFNIL